MPDTVQPPRFEFVLHVAAPQAELLEALEADTERVRRFPFLPFVALRSDHPWTREARVRSGRVDEVSDTVMGVLVGLDRVLDYVTHVRRMWAPNGNRWAIGTNAPAPFIFPDANTLGEFVATTAIQVPCRLGYPAALNLSLQLRPGRVLNPTEPLSVATRIASRHLPVLVAAGNWGASEDSDTLSPLAKLPWCISVGATSDQAGTRMWAGSSVGPRAETIPGQRAPGPTLVAHGEDAFQAGRYGTSFAAPVVARQALSITAFLMQVGATPLRPDGQWNVVPLPVVASVDTEFTDYDPAPGNPLPSVPKVGVDTDATTTALSLIDSLELTAKIASPTPAVVRRILQESAREVLGTDANQSGAGFVDDDTTLAYLVSLTGWDLVRLFDPAAAISEDNRRRLQQLKLADPDSLSTLLATANSSALQFGADFRTGEYYASTPTAAEMQLDPTVVTEPDPEPWPGRS